MVRAVADGFDVEAAKNELEGLKKEKDVTQYNLQIDNASRQW